MKEKACCFTGHSIIPANKREQIVARLEKTIIELYQQGVVYYGAGGALGFDYEKKKVMRSEVLDAA